MIEGQFMPQEYRNSDSHASGFPMYDASTLSGMNEIDRTQFGARVHTARKHAKLSQTALAKAVGSSQANIADAEKTADGSSFTAQIAQVCGVNPDWLATGVGEMLARPAGLERAQLVRPGKINEIAVVGRGNGGAMPQVIWNDGDYPVGATGDVAEIASSDPQAFVVEVDGPSMIPKYTPGNFALVEPNTAPDIEDDVLVRLKSGETLLKRLVSRRAGISLASYNDTVILFFKNEEVDWMYYVPYPVPRKKIKSRT